MNNIIGNTPYRNIQNKKYIDSTAEYIGKLADFLDKEQIPYSGRISEYKSTITVSGDENFKRASEILDKIKAENPRRFIGNTQYKYIRDKRIISMDADVVDKIAARLDSEHIMYSGIVEGKKGRITVGGSELEALVKGYIELERNGSAEIAYEIALTSDAYDDIYYICDQNGNAYYDEDGFAPTFNHVDDAERYAQIHHIPITVDETLMNHWREIEHTDKIRHDNSELVSAFPKSGEEYPDHFLYNAEGKSFQWIYYNPDGNFGEGEFVQKNIYEQDIIAAYNAKLTSPDEATGRNEFIYSLFSSCEETVISSDTEAFTAMAKEYINRPTGTIELYGIVENGTNISSIDMLISALEENCPAVLSEKEKTEDIVITENSDELIIDGYEGTWYVVDTETVDGKELFLLENEEYGDETFGIIIDKDRNVLVGEAWNGFSDYHEKYDNITLEEKLANKVGDEWKAFLDDMKKESPAVLIESAYEISTKDNIQTYITEENLDLSEKQINALLSSKNTLADLYDDWSSDEYLNSYSDVAELLKITAVKLSEAIDRENLMLFRKENRECANMIDAMAAKHYENNSFKAEAALDELLEKYSFERIQTIAAANVVELYDRLQDRRISEENYNWGKSVLNALPDNYRVEMQPVGSNRLTMHTGLIDLLANRVREYEARSIEKDQPAPERTAEDISIGDRYRYKGADVEVVSINGIYLNDVGISKTERMGNSEYAVTSNVDKYELHRNGQYLGNGEKAVVSELDMAKKYIGDYLDSEFSSEADFSDMKHIAIGYTEIGSEEQGDHSLQMEADLESFSVSYFIDDELAKTEHYDSLEQMNRDHLSVLNFEDMLHVGTTELDRILEEKEKNVPVTAVLAVSQYDTSRYYIANDITEEAVRNAIANSDKLFMDLCALGGTQITEAEFAQYSQTEGVAAFDVNIDEQTMHVYGAENPIVSFKEIRGIDEIADALDLENITLTFSVVTIDDEEPFVVGNYVGRYDITALDEYQEYIERTGKQFADVNVEFYQIGGDSESVSADDKECAYISEHLQEVMAHSDALCLESESYSVETPQELLDEEVPEQEEVFEHESEIEWTPIPETADDNGSPTSYATKYNDETFWISQNPDGKFDIEEKDTQGNFSSINDDFSGFMRRGEAEQYFEKNIGEYIAERDEKILDAIVGSISEPTSEQREEITRKNNTLNSFFNNNPLAVFREIVKSAGLEPTEDISIGDTKEIFNSLKSVDISLMGYTYGLEFEPHDDRLSVTDTASGRKSEFLWGHAKELMYLIANENNVSRENLLHNEVMRGTGFVDGKFRVEDFYKTNPEKKDFIDFLKKEYGIGGHSGDGPVKFADHDSKGIEITLTTGKENFTWNEVAKVISDLMDKGEYITQKDIDNRIRRAKLTIDNANEHTDFTSLVHAHEILQKYGIEDPTQDNEYKIYQLKNSPENHAIRFEGYSLAEKHGEPAKPENYDLVYTGSLDEFKDENKLEAIYTKFNLDRPEDFKGHSLSVSDIIVMNNEANYVDSYGFVDVSDKFMGKEKEQINLNDYEKISLVRRTEWNDRDLSDAENPAFEEITASYTPDEDGSFTKYAFNRTNSISVDEWEDENSVSAEDMLVDIEAHLKNMRSGVSSSEYYIELIDHDGNTRRLENNYFTFIHGEMAGIVEKSDSPEGKSAIKSKYTITNEKNSYMIVDDVRHAIDELSNGSDDEYDWTAFLTAYKSVMEANVQSDIALPLYKSGADKILSKANSNDTETISKSDYQNALACLDMVLKNGHLLKNPEEKEIEQFSFFSPRSNYISTDEIKPINVSHKNTEKENPITSKQDSITFSRPDSVNFTITESTFSNLGGDKTRCQNNIAAIRLLKQIEGEKRSATPDEQQILAKYIGWGGLANAFDSSKTDWSKEYAELKTLLTPEEYSSARSSTLNAHYTSYTIISSIYSALGNMGFKGGKILEPALGTGNFFGSMPEEMRNNSQLSGVELDSITGRIAKLLYPSANIQIKGYEDTNFENNSFDVAVSNVPFGSYKVNDKEYNKQNMLIHDYFFSKTLDKVRPGGIIAFVTSKGTLDKENSEVRKYLAERAELLGAIRLPNTAFKNNAGTEVTSDIIFLQKREKPISVEQNTPDWVFKDILDNGIAVNKYFADHPEMILGQMAEGNKMFGNGTTCIPFDGADLKEQLAAAIQNIKGKYNKTVKSAERENASHADTVSCPPDAPKYSYVISDDKLYYHKAGDTMELVDTKDTDRIKAMTQLRDGVHELLDLQINNYNGENEVKISDAQNKLSKDYDDFVDRFGRIGQAENKKAFANDNSYHLIKSLEKTDNSGNFIGKADIFSKKTINPQIVIDHCNNAQDALILSLSEKMRVDMDYMSMLTDKSESELVAELGDKIYQNPQINMRWESADEYLTGNIRAKLAAAEEAGLERNIEALRAVMPQRIEAADISVKLGSAWIDPEYIRQFILETLKPDFQTRNSIEVIYSEATDKWKVEGYQHSYGNTLATETYGTSDMNAYEIIEVSLNMKKAEIRERVKDENGIEIKDEKGRYVLAVNQDKTMVVQSKQDELKKKFKDWIFATPERREKLTNLYNEKFNSVRLREYDGSHLNFVGMNSNIALKPHQKNAVARSLYSNGNTLIAHEVGAGKTFEMVAIAMEGKRLGLHSKPLITAPNALTEQWGDAFRTLYPNSNVLVATEKDFKPENRRDLFAKIATGDWDAVIIGHSQFDMIHLSRERELETLYSEVDKLEAALDEISATSNKGSYSVKQVERAIKSYTDKIQKLLEKTPKEDMLCFEQLGIDKIFVDESQAYKNLDTPTKMQNVSGIGSGGSGRSMQLLMKCRYLDEVTGGKGVIFASGTPISNSMSEMYTLMRYLQADKLRELGINSFDRWASIFGETTTSMELSPEANGKYQMKTRFAKFQNLPELMNIFKECADIKTAATLNLDRPDFEMHNINVPATKMQAKMIKNLGERAKLIRAGAVDPTEDNMCKLTVDGRKIGLDQRCMNPSLPDDPNSKVNVCINNVFDIWKQTAEKKSTQLIFCDLATPQAAVNENTYTLYRKDTKGEYAPVYSAKLGQKDTADKIFKKLTGSKPPKNFKAGGVFDGDIIMLHTVDYDTMTASNSAVMALSGKITEIPEEMWTKLHHSPTETFESERKFCVYDDIKQKLVAKGVPEKEIAFIHDADTTEEKQKLFAKMNKGEIRVMIGSTQKCGAGMNAQERMIALHDLDAPMRPSDMEQRHGRIIRQGNTNTKVDIYRYTTDKTFDAYLYQMLENKQKFISQIMTDKSPVRSCEDVDEIALDYAEVKALCAGNPLIKEKIDLETEITKLNVLKSSFLSQKYAVQDKAYTILPREKSVKETYIDKLKKDVEFAEKEQPLQNEDGKNYYPVTVGDKKYHEKDAAGEAIRQAILDNKDILQGKEVHIGSYRGFEMTAFLDVFSKKIKVNLQGATNHYGELNMDINVKAGGNIIRLDNVINSIGITLMKEEEGLQAICADIEQAKAAADAVFPQEQELAAKEKRLEEVNAQLASIKVNTQDRSSELYAALVDICPALQYSKEFHCKYEAGEGIEPLCIERNGDVVFVAHTYTQNGDLMYDPAIEFYFDSKNQKAEALSYELSGMGMYQDFRDGNLPNEKADVEEMALETMFPNIKDYDYKLVETNIDTEIDEDERGEDKKEINR